jgi:flagellar biogenesis protein FliO
MGTMDLLDIARYLGALLLVLGLIGFAGLAARRFGLPGLASAWFWCAATMSSTW